MSRIILANDGIAANAKLELEKLGYVVDTNHYEGEELEKRIQEVECIIIRSATKIRESLIDKAVGSKLRLMIRAGVGLDNIDVKYAESKGFIVRNTPSASSAAVAELAIGHMFSLARYIYISNVTMRNGEWNKKAYKGIELAGKTLGLVGFGRISREVAKRALALGMDVIYFDISGESSLVPECKFVDLDELYANSDFISLHIPFIKEVGTVIGDNEFQKMKDGVYLVDTARGKVVSEDALIRALDSGKVAAAALDVFEEEPTRNEAIYTHPKISLTPHIGASTSEAQDRIGIETINIIKEIL
ncbi:D-2-hydroxyacid dehydrogenase [Mycoplasmatota bacterium]|nr:D-2-hydroxyacid dehydrogenase [Mycoplasmatota bacterium]